MNVLDQATPSIVEREPYPYFVIDDCLPTDLYERLAESFPSGEQIAGKALAQTNNTLFHWNAKRAIKETVGSEWHEFFKAHIAEPFWREVQDTFKLDSDFDSIGIRNHPMKFDLNLDCQFAVNTPPRTECSVRGPHVDNPVELYAGLLYFRHPDDDSTGGDLCLYEWKGEPRFIGKAEAREEEVRLVKTVEYKANRLVFFLNSVNALHGVTPRSVSPHYRRYINIIGEVRKPLFQLPR